jgi:hypothetical protein
VRFEDFRPISNGELHRTYYKEINESFVSCAVGGTYPKGSLRGNLYSRHALSESRREGKALYSPTYSKYLVSISQIVCAALMSFKIRVRVFRTRSKNRGILQDTRAISEVIGAVIILAILLSAGTLYLSQQVPEWTKEYEARHAAVMPYDFAMLTANIEQVVLSEEPTTATSTPVGMLPEGVPLVGIIPVGGTLYFNQSEETFECIACAPTEPLVSGSGYWNNTTDWVTFTDRYHVVVSTTKAELGPARRGNLTIKENTSLSGIYYLNTFSVVNNSTVTIDGRLTVHALKIFVDEGSSITADGKGWSGGLGNDPGKNGSGVGGGIGGKTAGTGQDAGDGGGGGGLGGNGGAGGDNPNSGGNASDLMVYLGPSCAGEIMGAGGGGGGNWKDSSGQLVASTGGDGGSGGGYVCFDAAVINISGNISACGANGEGKLQYGVNASYLGGGGGGGSGGWIKIIGDYVKITGALVASGGDGGISDEGAGGGGGGGGIIEWWYDSAHQLPCIPDVDAGRRGTGNGTQGENGTGGFLPDPNTPYEHSYNSTLFHYESGYLISNMTNVSDPYGGQVGYDTNSTHMCYGNVTYGTVLPIGTDIILRVRTSMYPDMRDAVPWGGCPPVANGTDISDLVSVSDGHRYIQWRAELITFDPKRTPELHWVNISYRYGDPIITHASGTIGYKSQYLYYPNYKLVYAHGATIRVQDHGTVIMLFPPPLFVNSLGTGTTLKLTTIDVSGEPYAVSGRVSTIVRATSQGAPQLKPGLNYANVTLKLTTAYPGVWAQWFNETCRAANLSYGTVPGAYSINQTGNTLQVTFYGNESLPVNVWLKRAGAEVKLVK